MKAHDEVSKKFAQINREPGKSRFRIVKLEDRIAPAKASCHLNPHGKVVGGKCDCYVGCYGGY